VKTSCGVRLIGPFGIDSTGLVVDVDSSRTALLRGFGAAPRFLGMGRRRVVQYSRTVADDGCLHPGAIPVRLDKWQG
jgi:hypothetical protein